MSGFPLQPWSQARGSRESLESRLLKPNEWCKTNERMKWMTSNELRASVISIRPKLFELSRLGQIVREITGEKSDAFLVSRRNLPACFYLGVIHHEVVPFWEILENYVPFVGGRVASRLVRSTPERTVRVWALTGDTVLCSWEDTTLTVPFSTQVYKWVPANCWGNLTKLRGSDQRWTSIPSRGSRDTSSRFMLQKPRDKLRQLWASSGSKASHYFTDWRNLVSFLFYIPYIAILQLFERKKQTNK